MKRRIIMSVFVIAALTGGAVSGMAQAARLYDELPREGCGPEGESPDEGFVGRMTKVLGLNDGQKEKIAAILKGVREKDTLLHQNLAETRKQLRSATQAASFDEAAIRALATKKGQLETDLIVSRAKVRSQINALLTPEQRAIAAKLHQGPPRKPEPGPCFDRDRRPPRPCGDEEGRPGPSFDGEW